MAFSSKIVIIFFSLALLAIAASAGNKNPSICSSISGDRDLCKKMIGNTHIWSKAMTKMLDAFRVKVLEDKPIGYGVADLLPKSIKPETRESTGKWCQVTYDNILYNVDLITESVKNNKRLLDNVGLMLTASFEECTYAIKDLGLKELDVSLSLKEVDEFHKRLQSLGTLLVAVNNVKH